MRDFKACLLCGCFATAIAAVPTMAVAQDTDTAGPVIIVTAQKREATLQDTPVAVTVIGNDALQESQARDIRDLAALAPSLDVSQFATSSSTEFAIRGVGTSPANSGLEPSVGVFVDGVYRSKQGAAISDFPVVERIEVIRGPQSSLYGRNTPAGVIAITTQAPRHEFGLEADVTIGNYDSRVFRGTITGPLSETVSFRLSGNVNKRDGFITNTFNGEKVNDRDRYGIRGQLLIEPTPDLSIRLIGDYNSIKEACCAAPFYFNNPANAIVLALLGVTVPSEDPYDREVSFNGELLTDQKTGGVSGQADWSFGNMKLTSITAWRKYKETNDIDADFVDTDLSKINTNYENSSTFTQELRLQSETSGPFTWLLGYYYYHEKFIHDRTSTFGTTLRPFADGVSGGAISFMEVGPFPFNPFPQVPLGTYLAEDQGLQAELFHQSTNSHAFFGQFDLDLSDRLTFTGGLRYSTEHKSVDSNVVIDDPFSALDLIGTGFDDLSAFQFFPPFENFSDSRSEDSFSGNAILAYDVSDEFNLYASYGRGYKSGGYNLSVGSVASARDFGAERMDAYEIGAKTHIGRVLQLNVAAFHQVLHDFQAEIFNGSTFDLTNAGSTRINGLEVESLVNPTDNLSLTFGLTHLDGKFLSFENAPCLSTDTPGVGECRVDGTRDISGTDIEFIPKWRITSTGTLRHDFGSFGAFLRGELVHVSSHNLGGDQDPHKQQGAYTTINASLGFHTPDDRWQLLLWARNLTKEEFAQGIFSSVAQPGSFSGYPNDPRTYGATISLKI